jgi:hypothetical protein
MSPEKPDTVKIQSSTTGAEIRRILEYSLFYYSTCAVRSKCPMYAWRTVTQKPAMMSAG